MPDTVQSAPFEAYVGDKPYLFVSYAHLDGPSVFPELVYLKGHGYRIWYDEGIDPGNEWPEEVAKALAGAAYFVVFVSPHAVKSQNVRNEINFALNNRKPFLAIHIVETELPAGLQLRMGDIQAILKHRMHDESYRKKLLKSLPEALRGPTLQQGRDTRPRRDVESDLKLKERGFRSVASAKKPEAALEIAYLLASFGDYSGIEKLLSPYATMESPMGDDIRSELGYAICKTQRANPESTAYHNGIRLLEKAELNYRGGRIDIPDVSAHAKRHASVLERLAWAYDARSEYAHQARKCYQAALELSPSDPHVLANVLSHEISYQRSNEPVAMMAGQIRTAIETCWDRLRKGFDIPYAAFAVGKLNVLRAQYVDALDGYALGLRHVLESKVCIPVDALDCESEWLLMVKRGTVRESEGIRWVIDLLRTAADMKNGTAANHDGKPLPLTTPILIVSGNGNATHETNGEPIREVLVRALDGFTGTIVASGVRDGASSFVADALECLTVESRRRVKLVAFLPRLLPMAIQTDDRYDELIVCGEAGFSPEQTIRRYSDVFTSGVRRDQVSLLGCGGGRLSATDYRIALGLGVQVGLVASSGGATDALLVDELWKDSENLHSLTHDSPSIRSFLLRNAEGEIHMNEEKRPSNTASHGTTHPRRVRRP